MIDGRRVAVVVPAHNEACWIDEVLGTLPAGVDLVVVVDDASSDDTAERARNADCPVPLTVLSLPRNRGVGGAIVAGYRHCLSQRVDVVVVMAGDGQMAPADLPALVAPVLREGGYAKGNRFSHPEVRKRMPAIRWWGARLLSSLTGWAVGQAIEDSQCGYTAVDRAALERIDLDRLWTGYGYPNDLLGLFAVAGVAVHQVPVEPRYRGEASGLRSWHFGVMLCLIGRARARRALAAAQRRSSAAVR